MNRRTACLNQANAFREKAVADPEHYDEWIDESRKWLDRAMEATSRVVVSFEIPNNDRYFGGAAGSPGRHGTSGGILPDGRRPHS